MARNTLGMILAGLGGGLTGYGQEQKRKAERDEETRRREFTEAVSMLGMGYEPEAVAKTRAERVGQALDQAGRVAGAAPSVPGMPVGGALQSALAQAGQIAPQSELAGGRSIELGGRQYIQRASQMPEAIAARERSIQTADQLASEAREEARQMRILEAQTRGRIRETQAETRGAGGRTGLTPNDRAFQAVLQYSRTPLRDALGDERMPTPDEVQAFAANAKAAEAAVYGESAPAGGRADTSGGRATPPAEERPAPAGTESPVVAWMRKNPKLRNETRASYEARYNASLSRGVR